jgi:ADP-ribose pyrophosphatase YjhB (NUDIX family)
LSRTSREYPDRPWVGVGIVVWRDDRVLLVRRAKPPRLGQWSIPGGAQALGETVFAAAVRETREEASIEIRPTGIITVVDSIVSDSEARTQFHYTLVEVAAEWAAGEAVAGDDVDGVCWATLEEAAGLIEWSETLRIIEEARRLRT